MAVALDVLAMDWYFLMDKGLFKILCQPNIIIPIPKYINTLIKI